MGGSDKGNDHPCQSGQEVGEPEKDLQVPWGGKCCCHPSMQLLSTLLIRLVLLMLSCSSSGPGSSSTGSQRSPSLMQMLCRMAQQAVTSTAKIVPVHGAG
uniref:Uncharacterized protein n=1 Tax=Knipowitschia caucasica TaxID=637954 RepID=A0AAV2M6N8_KNICA